MSDVADIRLEEKGFYIYTYETVIAHAEMIYANLYPPFGEVIDYTENADETIMLIIDGMWPDYNSDCAFTNQIVVQPFDDGTNKYLSKEVACHKV